ncbi:transposase [Sphingobium sp. WTD-1]|jgi:transposase|uniref:IS66-like element accessory protein TnpA n=1 Tax=Sphingobium sp. WTD-1 TaxID=2979467 RepID=UPI0024DE8D16|nr:transposase [Sphingobium sp. WTD-1]WIA54850.1 transposase [Sphingobium sp. WTD-1]WIA55164.1 transposase [Sphingobium sp. WTD-1]
MDRITVISGPERRRAWTAEQKEALVLAACAPGAVVADIARAADIHPSLIHRWRRELTQRIGPSSTGASFVPVVMKADASADVPSERQGLRVAAEIETRGAVIRFGDEAGPELVRAILGSLR